MRGNEKAQRLDGADFLRAAACAMVLLHHLALYLPFDEVAAIFWWLEPFDIMGGQGVAIFFVLSGFLLAGPFWQALDEGQPMPNLKIYFLRRIARIGPGFWLALTVTFMVAWLIFGAPLDAGYLLRYFAGVTFLAGLHWYTMFPVELNGPLWSIGFEVSAYVIMPLGFLAVFQIARSVKSKWALRAAWIGVIVVTLALHLAYVSLIGLGEPYDRDAARAALPFWHVYLGQFWFPEYNPIGFFATFAIGVLASGLHRALPDRRHWLFDALFLASLAITAFILWTNTKGGFDELLHLPYGLYPELPILLGAMLATGPRTIAAARVLEPSAIRYFAQISFGVYLWHMLFQILVTRFVFPEYERFLEMTSDVSVLLAASAIVIVASLLVAAASWRWIEQPAIRWARRKEAVFADPHGSSLPEPDAPAISDASQPLRP